MAAAMEASAIAGVPAIAIAVLQYSPAFARFGYVTMSARAGLIGCQRAAALALVCLCRRPLVICVLVCAASPASAVALASPAPAQALLAFPSDNSP